jgi:hypothetical protein
MSETSGGSAWLLEVLKREIEREGLNLIKCEVSVPSVLSVPVH